MNMVQAVKSVLGNYFNFQGRASRSEFWWFSLANFILNLIIVFVHFFSPISGLVLNIIVSLGLIIPSLAVIVRRLHDVDKSGWNYLWALTGIGLIFPLLIWYTRAGTEGRNRFDPPLADGKPSWEDDADYEAEDETDDEDEPV